MNKEQLLKIGKKVFGSKKNGILFIAMGLMVCLFIGCKKDNASTTSRDEIRVGYSFDSMKDDVRVKTLGFCQDLGKETTPKINFLVTNGENDVSKQLADIRDLISQEVDVIVVQPIDSAMTDSLIGMCNDAKIPILITNRPYNPNGKLKPDTFVGVDADYQGYIATKDVFDLMIKDGFTELNLLCLSGALTDENSTNRVRGVKKAVDEYANRGAKFVYELSTDWNVDFILANLPGTMRANPSVNCMYVASDGLLSGVQTTLEATNQWFPYGEKRHIYIASSDVFPSGLQMLKEGYIDSDSLFDIVNVSRTIVDYCLKLSAGEKPEEIYVKGPDYTRENCDSDEMKSLLW